jgi:hypothetical protein
MGLMALILAGLARYGLGIAEIWIALFIVGNGGHRGK